MQNIDKKFQQKVHYVYRPLEQKSRIEFHICIEKDSVLDTHKKRPSFLQVFVVVHRRRQFPESLPSLRKAKFYCPVNFDD